MKERILYPDICKFIAIFLVTWSHCANVVQGEGAWTNFLGGRQIDIAFNMPLFMLISGWFINLDKIRHSNAIEFVVAKFKRLIIPSIVWYLIHCILDCCMPGLFGLIEYYWYLNALFACLCIIMVFAKVIRNDIACCVLSIIFVLIIPYFGISNINFMFPFLWAGYGLRRVISTKYALTFSVICFCIGIALCSFWDPKYTVYISPFNSLYINSKMVFAYVYRFVIGFTLSAFIIYILTKIKTNKNSKLLAKYGTYSLVIYTSSFAFNEIFRKCLNYFGWHTSTYMLIDLTSLCLCLIIVCLTIKFSDYCRKNRYLSLLLLGE